MFDERWNVVECWWFVILQLAILSELSKAQDSATRRRHAAYTSYTASSNTTSLLTNDNFSLSLIPPPLHTWYITWSKTRDTSRDPRTHDGSRDPQTHDRSRDPQTWYVTWSTNAWWITWSTDTWYITWYKLWRNSVRFLCDYNVWVVFKHEGRISLVIHTPAVDGIWLNRTVMKCHSVLELTAGYSSI